MVTVTPRAKEALARIRVSANVSDPMVGLRLEKATAGRFGLFPDHELTESLAGAKIDGKTTDQGFQLVIAQAREE